jgi:hypothetical protein
VTDMACPGKHEAACDGHGLPGPQPAGHLRHSLGWRHRLRGCCCKTADAYIGCILGSNFRRVSGCLDSSC